MNDDVEMFEEEDKEAKEKHVLMYRQGYKEISYKNKHNGLVKVFSNRKAAEARKRSLANLDARFETAVAIPFEEYVKRLK